ncbi:hypothetical protein AUJ65_00285 [Candidatus Micrarchaeota archaeon CG1_02_51_15]|nr:MAG: hypothetical protein AUJ65_00285 [Candidatus Micrarchaeota archaeon CG1_02_51_15]
MKGTDVVVVGASVCGAVCSRELASKGVRTLLLEEHSKAGKFGKCTGIVSKHGLGLTGVDYRRTVVNEVSGADFHSGKACLTVCSPRVQALVIDRQAFDEQAVAQAVDAGAELLLGARVDGLCGTQVNAGNKRFKARFAVGADGAASAVARLAGFPAIPAGKFVLGYEAEYSRASVADSSKVDVFFEPEFRGFFGWKVPCSPDSARIGFCTSDFASLELGKRKLMELPRVRETIAGKARRVREFAAVIPLALRRQTQRRNVLLVGDAAGQVKATTGGGIVFGSVCARTVAECIASQLRDGTALNYEWSWRAKFGKALALHSALRSAANALPSGVWPACVSAASALGVDTLLEKFGDMDFVVR